MSLNTAGNFVLKKMSGISNLAPPNGKHDENQYMGILESACVKYFLISLLH